MPDFGFVGPAYEAPSIYQDAQELINWYQEIDVNDIAPQGMPPKRGVIALYPTPGYTVQVQLPSGEVRGMYAASNGVLYVVCGNFLYSINTSWRYINLGSLMSSTGQVSISDNGIDLYIVDGMNRYSLIFATSVFSIIPPSDGAFTGADKVYTVDNYFIYNRPGTQQWAASTALSTVTPGLSFSSKDGSPDNLVSMIVVQREIFLLGSVSSEVWIDVGSFPFPFQRIPGTNTQHGCAAKHSVSRLGESFAFVSQDSRGQGIILRAQGYGFVRLSTHAVENSLVGKTISDAIAFTYQREGHEFYVLTFPAADITWVYDLSTDKWHKWLSVDAMDVYHRHPANCHAIFNGVNLIGDYQNGAIYALSNSVYTDNGNMIKRTRRCPHIVNDFKRVFFEELQIQFQPGVGLTTGQGSDPAVMLRWSDDGGSTYGPYHTVKIGKQGQYKNRAIQRRMGWGRDRIYEAVVTDPINAVVISANLIATTGEN